MRQLNTTQLSKKTTNNLYLLIARTMAVLIVASIVWGILELTLIQR